MTGAQQEFVGNKELDEAIFPACGWENDLPDEEILEKLLALNFEGSNT